MKVSDFSILVSKREGLKTALSIAQIKEVLRVSNDISGGQLYTLIKGINTTEGSFAITESKKKSSTKTNGTPKKSKR